MEKDLLRNERRFFTVFERIFQKYGREFTEDEPGAEVIESEADIDLVIDSERNDFSNTLSAPIELSSDDESETDDAEVAALLHEKVVQVKREINYDEEELEHQKKQRLKNLRKVMFSDDSESEDEQVRQSRPHKKKARLSKNICRPSNETARVVSTQKLIKPKSSTPTRNSRQPPKPLMDYVSGYEDLDTTNCTLETCMEISDNDSQVSVSGTTSAPELEADLHDVAVCKIHSKSMFELGGSDFVSQEEGSETEEPEVENKTETSSSTLKHTSKFGNELLSGYETNFDSDTQEECKDPQVSPASPIANDILGQDNLYQESSVCKQCHSPKLNSSSDPAHPQSTHASTPTHCDHHHFNSDSPTPCTCQFHHQHQQCYELSCSHSHTGHHNTLYPHYMENYSPYSYYHTLRNTPGHYSHTNCACHELQPHYSPGYCNKRSLEEDQYPGDPRSKRYCTS